jgi:hypothetical protein
MSGPDIGWIKRAQEAGMSDDDIQLYLNAWTRPVHEVSAGAMRQRRYMEKKKALEEASPVTSDDVINDAGNDKERSPTPPKEITTKNLPSVDQKEAEPQTTVAAIFPDAEDIELALDAYRQVAELQGLPMVRKMSESRRRSLKRRLRDAGSLEVWYEAVQKLQRSKFLCGIRADLDFLLQEKTFIRLLEGKYDDNEKEVLGSGRPANGAYSRAT